MKSFLSLACLTALAAANQVFDDIIVSTSELTPAVNAAAPTSNSNAIAHIDDQLRPTAGEIVAESPLLDRRAAKKLNAVPVPVCNAGYTKLIEKAQKRQAKLFCQRYKPRKGVKKSPIKGFPSAQALSKACQCYVKRLNAIASNSKAAATGKKTTTKKTPKTTSRTTAKTTTKKDASSSKSVPDVATPTTSAPIKSTSAQPPSSSSAMSSSSTLSPPDASPSAQPSSTQATTTSIQATGTPAVFAVAPYPSNLGSAYNFTGTRQFTSAHFSVWNTTEEIATGTLKYLEGAYDCFVVRLGHRNPGVPFFNDAKLGPFYKVNEFISDVMPVSFASGVTTGDSRTGLGFSFLLPDSAQTSGITVHEFGHVLTFSQQHWWNQSRSQGWAEPIAQYVNEAYVRHPMCAASRASVGEEDGGSLFTPEVTIAMSHMTLVDASQRGNSYQAWPFLMYLSNNPDAISGLGNGTLLRMFEALPVGSNLTPFHVIQRVVGSAATTQSLVGRYWARLAWTDLADSAMQRRFNLTRTFLDYNTTSLISDTTAAQAVYRVLSEKRPQYMGATFIPLETTSAGQLSVRIDASSAFTATLAIRNTQNQVTYQLLTTTSPASGAAAAAQYNIDLATDQSAILVLANTPTTLLNYETYDISGAVAVGLDFNVTLAGAKPALVPRFTMACYEDPTRAGC